MAPQAAPVWRVICFPWLSLPSAGKEHGQGASQEKMVPQAVAKPALPVLPCQVSKHPTRLTHWAAVSLPPTSSATPSVSLSFYTDTSASFPLPSTSSACLSGHPLAVALLPQESWHHHRLPGHCLPSLKVLLATEMAPTREDFDRCQTPAASPKHPPWWHLWP